MKQAEFGGADALAETPTHRRTGRSSAFTSAAALALLAALGTMACGKAGGHSISTGQNPPPVEELEVDFALRRDLHLGSAYVGDVVAADLNGDTWLDLIEANFYTMEITIAFGDWQGIFTPTYHLATQGHGWKVNVADLDGDGMLDVVLACGDYNVGTGISSIMAFLQGPNLGEFGQRVACENLEADPKDVVPAPRSLAAGDPALDILFVPLRDAQKVVVFELSGIEAGGCDDFDEIISLESSSLGNVGGPFSAAVIDIADDGHLDLVVGESDVEGGEPDRVISYAYDGQQFLAPAMVFEPAFLPIVENVGDVNGDAFEDLSVAQGEADEVLLLLGDGSGLGTGGTEAVYFEGVTSSAIFADVNDDGYADAIGTVLTDHTVSVHLSNGELSWDEPMRYSVGMLPRAIALIKRGSDTIPDLLCSNAQDLSILDGLGEGLYRGALGYPTLADGPRTVKTADFDNDGDLDAVSISADEDAASFLEGRGDGTLETKTTVPLEPISGETPIYVAVADVDDDGFRDVLLTIYELDELRLLRNPGTVGGFTEPDPGDVIPVGDRPLGVDVADFDEDDLPDVVVGCGGDETLQLLLNQGAGEFIAQPPIPIGFAPSLIRTMDFDNDGHVDVAATTGDASGPIEDVDRNLVLFSGDGAGNLTQRLAVPIASVATSMDFGDLDGNGLVDIVVAPTGNEYDFIFVLLNFGNFNFSVETLQVGTDPASVIVADVNDDENHYLDLLIPTGWGELLIAKGDGTGSFSDIEPPVRGTLPLLLDTLSVDYADMNTDNLPDLVMVSKNSPMVWVGINISKRKVAE